MPIGVVVAGSRRRVERRRATDGAPAGGRHTIRRRRARMPRVHVRDERLREERSNGRQCYDVLPSGAYRGERHRV
jgi:hypothetical protein